MYAGLLLGLAGLGALSLTLSVGWWASVSRLWLWVGGLAWLGWSALALASWRRSLQGHLQWDARASGSMATPEAQVGGWRWRGPQEREPANVDVVEWALDAQAFLLLKLHLPGDRQRWVWLEAQRDPARWDDLRRALTLHARRR